VESFMIHCSDVSSKQESKQVKDVYSSSGAQTEPDPSLWCIQELWLWYWQKKHQTN